MGKVLETKYSDVSHRILKRVKKDKPSVKHSNKNVDTKNKSSTRKRKISGINDNDFSLPNKLPKVSTEETVSYDQNQILNELHGFKEDDILINQIYAEKSLTLNYFYLKIRDDSDLFLDDELRNSHMNFIYKDFYFHIFDEICLEGLDGITIEAFWKRLLVVLEGIPSINGFIKDNIWQIIMNKQENVNFYELPVPRRELEIYNRFNNYNWEVGMVMELAYELPDIYTYSSVNDPKFQGSCANFDDRVEVSEKVLKLNLKEIEKMFGNKLAIVADQRSRTIALLSEFPDPLIEMPNIEYCILERIGRSRRLGETTQGNMSLTSALRMDSKSMFHYRKRLYKNRLISEQFFFMKAAITEQNKAGKLLFLRRFFTFLKSRLVLIASKAINILKKQPGYRMEISKLKRMFAEDGETVGKTFKSSEFRKYVKTDCVYPYRFMYPNAKKSEYMNKSISSERALKCYELKDPHVNIVATWDNENEDSDEDEDEVDEGEICGSKFHNMEVFKEIYYHVYSKGVAGCSLSELNQMIGVDRNTCRMAIKKLVSQGVLNFEKFDMGRQHTLIYKVSCLHEAEQVSKPQPAETLSLNASSSIRARMIERQRAAILKSKESRMLDTKQNPPQNDQELRIPKTCPILFRIEAPQISNCHFFIQNYTEKRGLENAEPELRCLSFPTNRVRLTYKVFSASRFNISEILDKIIPIDSKLIIKINFHDFYSAKTHYDPIAKLILLKAMFGEVTLNGLTCSEEAPQDHSDQTDLPKPKQSISLYEAMGANPVTVFRDQDKNVITEIIMSTPPQEETSDAFPEANSFSEKVASRTNLIIDLINEKKLFEEPHKLLRMIHDEEAKKGYNQKMDRKSFNRILKRITEKGLIKIYKVLIYDSSIAKILMIICHPSISHDDDQIKAACQQIKWKFFMGSAKKTNVPSLLKKVKEKMKETASPFSESDVMISINEMKRLEKMKNVEAKKRYSKYAGRRFGLKPKFIRMRILHEFLFYLIYEHEENTQPVPKEEVEELFRRHGIEIMQEELDDIPTVYSKEISWTMFIPPLPRHKGWPDGWALMCDVILRFPISVLCKVHNCSYDLPELYDILHHPVKRFYLVKDLPESIQTVILYKRKYLFSIHETVSRLAHCGLVQYGPQKYKEKDQFFIYLNRHATLLDTSSSEPSYNYIENKEYPVIRFDFNSQADVDSYWYNLFNISMSTKLNARKQGQLVILTDISANPQLMKTVESRTCEEALRIDNGDLPGDKRGAGGLDSSLWSHLTRNWFHSSKGPGNSDASVGLKKDRIDVVLPKIAFKNLVLDKSNKIFLQKAMKEPATKTTRHVKPKRPEPLKPSKTFSLLKRRIPCRDKKKRREYHDNIDKVILKKMGINRRVKWTESEDKVLILAKVADLLLQNNKYKKQFVPYTAVRDVLHRICPESKYKTSRAVQRRQKNLQKECSKPLDEVYMNLLQVRPIVDNYWLLINDIWQGIKGKASSRLSERQITNAFIILMSYIIPHQDEVFDVLQGNLIDIDHLSEENLRYTVQRMVEIDKSPLKFQDAACEDDIKKDVLKAVIHSSVLSTDISATPHQLLKLYQKYPDHLLRDAVEELRQSNTITHNRFHSKKDKLWRGPYHISQIYIFYQFTTHNATTAKECYKTFSALRPYSESRSYLDFSEEGVSLKRYGQMIGVNEFCTFWDRVRFHFDLPQNMIILNPAVTDHDELVNELALRYQQKLKRMQQESNENDKETEADTTAYRQKSSGDSNPPPPSALEDPTNQPMDIDDLQTETLDLTIDAGNMETINRLRTWVSDCITGERERRSPSPDFVASAVKSEEPELEADGNKKDGGNGLTNSGDDATTRRFVRDQILTLEEIKEEMLKVGVPNEDRIVPYITELSDLLNNRDSNSDTTTDEQYVKHLKNHFVAQYAQLSKIDIEDLDLLMDDHMINYLENTMTAKKMWEKVRSDISVEMVVPLEKVPQMLVAQGGQKQEFKSMLAIVDFVSSKGFLGATGQQLKDQFSDQFSDSAKTTLALSDIVKILVDCGVFLQAGICNLCFVHYWFRDSWLVETFETETPSEEQEDSENPEEQKIIKLQMTPWHKISGQLNKDSFKTWICCILSYCVECPGITFYKLCGKFFYLKPVDVYYLLVILQELGSVEIMWYDRKEEYLFSKWEQTKQRRATFLDSFDDIAISPTNVALTCLGLFLNYDQVLEVPLI